MVALKKLPDWEPCAVVTKRYSCLFFTAVVAIFDTRKCVTLVSERLLPMSPVCTSLRPPPAVDQMKDRLNGGRCLSRTLNCIASSVCFVQILTIITDYHAFFISCIDHFAVHYDR